MLINPGSKIAPTAAGWSNTYERAQQEAARRLKSMHEDDGMTDVEIVRSDPKCQSGRWAFYFRHKVTGVEVVLETHGIDDLDAYKKVAVFTPRVYWKGSSSSNPHIEDFAATGFRVYRTFVPVISNDCKP